MTDAAADLTIEELAEMHAAAFAIIGDRDATSAASNAAYVTCMAIDAESDRRIDEAFAPALAIAEAHFVTAIDQASDYDSVDAAIEIYGEFAMDTAIDANVDTEAVHAAYSQLVAAQRFADRFGQ